MSDYKRDHPRISECLAVEIIVAGKRTLFASTENVSKSGMQLVCDGTTVREIFGGSVLSLPAHPLTVTVKLRLAHPGQTPEQVEAECRPVFSRRVSEQEYRVGLQIRSLPKSAREALDGFVDGCLARN